MRGEDYGGIKNAKQGLVKFALAGIAAVGLILIIFGGISSKESDDKKELEKKFEDAILMIDGITEANVIITETDGKITGAAAVCRGGNSDTEEKVTELLCSGLSLSASKIYVVCNK